MYNFLLIEDSAEDSATFQDTIKRLNLADEGIQYHLDVAATYDEGIRNMSKNLNGIIVDIKLDDGHNGNEIIHEIFQHCRVPVAIFTGTPDTEPNDIIKVYKKGEATHEEIIHDLCEISDTGLFNVLGGTGTIEDMMARIFWNNLYRQIDLWKEKKVRGTDTEKVLLRYAVAHIQEMIDNEIPVYVTEEMYISPPINNEIKTGSILQSKSDNQYYIVLSPPCDMAVHDGKIKTDSVLVCKIESQDEVNEKATSGITKTQKQEKQIAIALKNNYTEYYHWLPQNSLFDGGYINFRKAFTYSPDKLFEKFSAPVIKIQEGFVKSILGRFSAYYARQGQPDFNFNEEAKKIMQKFPVSV